MQLHELKKMMEEPARHGDKLLRAIANYADWYLCTDEKDCAFIWEFDGKRTIGVMSERKSPTEQNCKFLEMRGRHLMKNLPDETQRIAFGLGKEHCVFLSEDGVARLKNIALALNCEEAIAAPPVLSCAKDITESVERILNHEWIVLWNDKLPVVIPYKGLEGIMLFTATDNLDAFLAKQPDPDNFHFADLEGPKLFELLDSLSNYDCVYINACSDLELFPFAPGQIHELANERQPRPERKILQARSQAEIDYFLDESGMQNERPYQTENINSQSVIHYTGKIMPGLEQRTFRFCEIKNRQSKSDWGDGPSQIVCGGKLADLLKRRIEILDEEPKPLSKDMKEFVQTAIIWANELEKLIDQNTQELPRKVLRTVDGARFVREFPHIGTKDFVVQSRAKLDALTATI